MVARCPVMFYLGSKTRGVYFIPLPPTVHNQVHRLRDDRLLCSQQEKQIFPFLLKSYRHVEWSHAPRKHSTVHFLHKKWTVHFLHKNWTIHFLHINWIGSYRNHPQGVGFHSTPARCSHGYVRGRGNRQGRNRGVTPCRTRKREWNTQLCGLILETLRPYLPTGT